MGGALSRMADIRRRRATAAVHPEDQQQLAEPLLAGEEVAAEDAPVQAAPAQALQVRRRAAEQRELPWPLPALLHALEAAWHFVVGLFRRLLPWAGRRRVVPLSDAQQERLEQLRQRASATFDDAEPQHQAALQELWAAAFPGRPCPPSATKHEQWKELGFQSDVPSRDLSRAAGVLTVQCLLFMAKERPASFLLLAHKQAGTRSDWEYPFAAGAQNVVFTLCEVVGLLGRHAGAEGRTPAATPAAAGFAALLGTSGTAFEELFVLSYRLLDAIWLDKRASYMEFPAVLSELRKRVEAGLASSGIESVPQLEAHLLPGPT